MQLELRQLCAKSLGCPCVKIFRVSGEKELLSSFRAKSHLVLCMPTPAVLSLKQTSPESNTAACP